jgi:hypothetical protein
MQDYKVKIRGVVPLMHNRYPLDAMMITKKKPRGTLFNPTEKAKECVYVNTKGEIYQPSDHIEGALIQVGSSKSVPGQGKKTFKDQMKTNIAVLPTEIPFPNGKDYEVDVRLGVIPATRGRVPVARPRWDKWEFDFTIRVFDETMLDGETVKELLETAGKTKGIGTYRPKFGRFEVAEFEPIKP